MTPFLIAAILGAFLPPELVLSVSAIASAAVLVADHEERRGIRARRRMLAREAECA